MYGRIPSNIPSEGCRPTSQGFDDLIGGFFGDGSILFS
jgi:hypothetical protein